jgi:hypothetical protein
MAKYYSATCIVDHVDDVDAAARIVCAIRPAKNVPLVVWYMHGGWDCMCPNGIKIGALYASYLGTSHATSAVRGYQTQIVNVYTAAKQRQRGKVILDIEFALHRAAASACAALKYELFTIRGE